MKGLSVIGTIAMFLVGGGIFTHNLPIIHHFVETLNINPNFSFLVDLVVGIIVGIIACLIILPLIKVFSKKESTLKFKSVDFQNQRFISKLL